MAQLRRIEVIYPDGTPDGIKFLRLSRSNDNAYVIPRPLLNNAKNFVNELDPSNSIKNPGIYYLINEDENDSIAKVYIGETRNGIDRIFDHNREKDFWNKAILFLSDEQYFTPNIILGLEELAIKKANEANRYNILNSSIPKNKIKNWDYYDIEEYYNEIEFLLSTLGYKMTSLSENTNIKIFKTKRRGIIGLGVYSSDKFELLEGLEIDMNNIPNNETYKRQRNEFLNTGVIIKNNEGKYILTKTLEFKTPSGASDFVLGGSTNGWTEWKDQNGLTLDKLYRSKNLVKKINGNSNSC